MMGSRVRLGAGRWAAAACAVLLLLAALPAGAAPCSSQLPTGEPGPARVAALADLLRQPPRQPSARLERSVVTTEGWLLRARILPVRPACQGDAFRTAMIWLGVKRPSNSKRPASRHNALVALVAVAVLRDQLGAEPSIDKLIGSRIRLTGLLSFNPARRGELNRTRATLWELRQVAKIAVCGNAECPPPAPPPPPPPEAAPPPPPEPPAAATEPPAAADDMSDGDQPDDDKDDQ